MLSPVLRPLLICVIGLHLATVAMGHPERWNTLSTPAALPCTETMPLFEFELTRAYRTENAFLLLWAAALAEAKDRTVIVEGIKAWGFDEAHLIGQPERGAYAYLAEDEDFHLLSFRGTNSFEETLVDYLFFPSPFTPLGMGGQGHTGMMLHFKNLLAKTETLLRQLDPRQEKPLLITGHSLGGAMALLHALHFAKTGWDLIGVYTSAQPRVGDAAFHDEVAQRLQGRYFRMEAALDLTPRVPPSAASAEVFSQLVPDAWSAVQNEVRRAVLGMRYDRPRGSHLHIGSSLGWQDDDDPEHDHAYWRTLRGTITGAASFADLMRALQQRFDIHPPQQYMCEFLKAWRKTAG